ncbi:Alpha/Beta hydrolase protein [Zopfochytrium polystomum]|nr:Alpha/Beta hydrolase protein [Zopfochytrium polystomum]
MHATAAAAVLSFHVFNPDATPAHPVLAIHGIQGHALRWRFLADVQAAHPVFPTARTIVAVDLRGHGASTRDAPWTVAQHIRDVAATLDAYRESSPPATAAGADFAVDLLGHSFGGFLSLHFWAAHPALVRTLILVDPGLKLPVQKASALAESFLDPRKNAFDSVEQAALERSRSLHKSALAAAGGFGNDGVTLVRPHPAVQNDIENHLEQFRDPYNCNAEKFRFRWSATAIIAGISEVAALDVPNPPRDEAPRPAKVLLVRAAFEDYVREDIIADMKQTFGDDRLVDSRWTADTWCIGRHPINLPTLSASSVASFEIHGNKR